VRLALVVRIACSDNISHNTDKANAMFSQLDKEVDKEIGKASKLPAAERANFDEHISKLGKFQFTIAEGVHTGYRVNLSWGEVLASLFKWHNETMNVWTHLFGAVLFCSFGYYLHTAPDMLIMEPIFLEPGLQLEHFGIESRAVDLNDHWDLNEWNMSLATHTTDLPIMSKVVSVATVISTSVGIVNDSAFCDQSTSIECSTSGFDIVHTRQSLELLERWPIYVFLATAVTCLTCSFAFHLLFCKSEAVYAFMVRLDYSGVCCLIAGSYVPWLYYTFYCTPTHLKFYLGTVAVLGTSTFVMSLFEFFSRPSYVFAKTCTFVTFGMFAFIPIGHALIIFGPTSKTVESFLAPLLLEGVAYLLGAIIFVKKFPENVIPGCVDKLGSSHQLWHILVLAGALLHCVLCVQQFNFRQQHMCEA
jgi:channel protein (hemolysin III family)